MKRERLFLFAGLALILFTSSFVAASTYYFLTAAQNCIRENLNSEGPVILSCTSYYSTLTGIDILALILLTLGIVFLLGSYFVSRKNRKALPDRISNIPARNVIQSTGRHAFFMVMRSG